MVACFFCEQKPYFATVTDLERHVQQAHNEQALSCSPFYRFETAFRNFAARYVLALNDRDDEAFDVSTLFQAHRDAMKATLEHFRWPLRFFITLCVALVNISGGNYITHYLNSRARSIWALEEAEFVLPRICEELTARLENYQEGRSGLTLAGIRTCEIHVGRLRPSRVGCGGVDLPVELREKRCLVNVDQRIRDDERDKCFMFSVLAGLHREGGYKRRRASSYRDFADRYKWNFEFPVTYPRDVRRFERDNDVSINVFGYDEDGRFVYPLKIVDEEKPNKHVDLLLTNDHFVLISDFSKLFEDQRTLRFRCKRCMEGFVRKKTYETHMSYCKHQKPAKIIYPEKGKTVKFDKPYQTERCPFFGVFDFEAIIAPGKERRHVPSSCCLLIVRTRDYKIEDEFLYRGPDCVQKFIGKLNSLARLIPNKIKALNQPMRLTRSDEEQHSCATHCALCGEPFTKKLRLGITTMLRASTGRASVESAICCAAKDARFLWCATTCPMTFPLSYPMPIYLNVAR